MLYTSRIKSSDQISETDAISLGDSVRGNNLGGEGGVRVKKQVVPWTKTKSIKKKEKLNTETEDTEPKPRERRRGISLKSPSGLGSLLLLVAGKNALYFAKNRSSLLLLVLLRLDRIFLINRGLRRRGTRR